MLSATRSSFDILSYFESTSVEPPTAAPSIIQTILSQSDRRPVASSTLVPGAPSITVPSIPTSLQPSALPSSAGSVPRKPQSLDTLITIIADQCITACPTAVDVDGFATLTPAAPALKLDGTLLSLNTAGELIVGASKTVTLGAMMGSPVSGAPLAFASSSALKENSSIATGALAGHGAKPFEGGVVNGKRSSMWRMIAMLTVFVTVLVYVRWK